MLTVWTQPLGNDHRGLNHLWGDTVDRLHSPGLSRETLQKPQCTEQGPLTRELFTDRCLPSEPWYVVLGKTKLRSL